MHGPISGCPDYQTRLFWWSGQGKTSPCIILGNGAAKTATVTVRDSTFAGTSATVFGGGLFNSGGATVAVSDSTFADNSAGFFGGGIDNFAGTVTVCGSTFAGNSASAG